MAWEEITRRDCLSKDVASEWNLSKVQVQSGADSFTEELKFRTAERGRQRQRQTQRTRVFVGTWNSLLWQSCRILLESTQRHPSSRELL